MKIPFWVILLAILILVGCGISSCSKKDELSLIRNSSCLPPCWNEITPGVTNGNEAVSLLKKMSVVNQKSVIRKLANQYLYDDHIFCSLQTTIQGNISLSENTVAEIAFSGVNYQLKDIIELYGTPDKVVLFPYDGRSWKVNILYEKKGVWLYYIKQTSKKEVIKIQPADRISILSFFYPPLMNIILSDFGSRYLKDESLELNEVLQSWEGYREITIIVGKDNQ